METSNFFTILKANDSLPDLSKVFIDFKALINSIAVGSRASVSLKVLCILCSNLNKIPSWCDGKLIDHKSLMLLTIECVRETRAMLDDDRAMVLSCIYHMTRHVQKMDISIPPELILKLFYMPYEYDIDKLITKHSAIYWNILSERLAYIEKLKVNKFSIIKLLPKLLEDVQKVIQMFDTLQFCSKVLVFIVKKLSTLYSGTEELNNAYEKIFQCLSKKYDTKFLEKVQEAELIEFYSKVNECLVIIAECSSKLNFKDSILSSIVRNCTTMFGHRPDMFHCFQTFYLNAFCCILTGKSDPSFVETVINGLLVSFEITQKMGYEKVMNATYPYLSQLFRLYIEYTVIRKKNWKADFSIEVQESCMKLMLQFLNKPSKTEQILKCENCKIKTGLHDILWLSFLIKHLISTSLDQNLELTKILPLYYNIIQDQYKTLDSLRSLNCANHEKLFRKLHTDIHNSAISLNKAKYYEYSLKLFDIYLTNEMACYQNNNDKKNISRALYNKAICELDCKLYGNALKTACLCVAIVEPQALTEKYMSLVIDVKGKALKADDEEKQDVLQLVSVLDACVMCLENDCFGNLKSFLCHLDFGALLKHEFEMYKKLWPSMVPIAGVWRSLNGLLKGTYDKWITVKKDEILWMLYEIVLETPVTVRSIHCDYYVSIVTELLETFESKERQSKDVNVNLVHATLLFMKCEYDLAAASQKYGWKQEQSMDLDQISSNRTFPQEHAALKGTSTAILLLSDVAKQLGTAPVQTKYLHLSLQMAQVYVYQYLHLHRLADALQLAHVCSVMAQHVGDSEACIRNISVLVYHASYKCDTILSYILLASEYCSTLLKDKATVETAVVFICDVAMYYYRIGSVHTSAKLVQLAQAKILQHYDACPDVNVDLAVGRLMEAQTLLCKDSTSSYLSAVNTLQRHYLAVTNSGTNYTATRRRSHQTQHLRSLSCSQCVVLSRSLLQRRRARLAAAVSLAPSTAHYHASLCATSTSAEVQSSIDNRLKHILGLQPSNEIQPLHNAIELKTEPFTPKNGQVETMLENLTLKKTQTSPSIPCISVPAFKKAEFLNHSKKCLCYACGNPNCIILFVKTSGLEASMYFKAKEYDIARNYYDGVMSCFKNVDVKIKCIVKKYREVCEEFVVDIVEKLIEAEFDRVQVEILIDAAFFEMSQKMYEKCDDCIVRIHEIIENNKFFDDYLLNDVYNLMVASAELRKVKKVDVIVDGLSTEMDGLKIVSTPTKNVIEEPMTPQVKNKPPKSTKIIVKDEEIPKLKRKVIKLNLDEAASEEKVPQKRVTNKNVFKIPVPVTSKPVLESITPRPSRSKPDILVTQPSFDTPKPKEAVTTEFFTPQENTPNEQFFTPITSVKTYTKKSLRHNIVKNLESEFSTPKGDKENSTVPLERNALEVPKSLAKKREALKTKERRVRATSPGKLCTQKTCIPTRRRLRQPVHFSVDEDDKR